MISLLLNWVHVAGQALKRWRASGKLGKTTGCIICDLYQYGPVGQSITWHKRREALLDRLDEVEVQAAMDQWRDGLAVFPRSVDILDNPKLDSLLGSISLDDLTTKNKRIRTMITLIRMEKSGLRHDESHCCATGCRHRRLLTSSKTEK